MMEIAPAETPVRTLSGGNQRRAEIARALLSQPLPLSLIDHSPGWTPRHRPSCATPWRRGQRPHLWVNPVDEVAEVGTASGRRCAARSRCRARRMS